MRWSEGSASFRQHVVTFGLGPHHHYVALADGSWPFYEPNLAVDADAIPDRILVHVVHGSCDTSAPIDTVRALVAGRPNWYLTELESVGHQPWLSAPDVCAALVADLGVGETTLGPDRERDLTRRSNMSWSGGADQAPSPEWGQATTPASSPAPRH